MLRRVVLVTGVVLAVLLTPSVALADVSPSGGADVGKSCAYSGKRVEIRQGDSGPLVSYLQCLLRIEWRYQKVAVDGQFGEITRAAVIAHQKDCEIGVDGIVGPETWRHLEPKTTTKECLD